MTEDLSQLAVRLRGEPAQFPRVRAEIEAFAVNPSEVPDMPDRIIAATALHLRVPIISRDGKIRASQFETIW